MRLHREAKNESVGGARIYPADQFIDHVFGRSEKCVFGVATSSATSRKVCPLLRALALMRSVVERKLLRPRSPSSGNGASSGYCAEVVMIEKAAEIRERFVDIEQIANRAVLRFGLFMRGADNRADTGEYLHVVAATPMRLGAIGASRCAKPRPLRPKTECMFTGIRIFAGQCNARIRRAGLEDRFG